MGKKDEREKSNKNVSPKHDNNKKYNLRKDGKKRKKRRNVQSDSDEDSSSDYDPMNDDGEMDNIEFQKFIQKLFPSKSQKEKVKQYEKMKSMLDKQKEDKFIKKKKLSSEKKKVVEKFKNATTAENKIVSKKKVESEDEEEEEEYSEKEYSDDYEFPDEEEELDDDEIEEMLKNNMKFNIVFTVGNGQGEFNDEYFDEEYDIDDYADEYLDYEQKEEEEKKMTNPKKEKKSKYEKGDRVQVKLKDWDKFYDGTVVKVNKKNKKILNTYNIRLDDNEYELCKRVKSRYMKKSKKENEHDEEKKLLDDLKELIKTKKGKNKKAMEKHFESLSQAYDKKMKKVEEEKNKKKKQTNLKKFRSLLRQNNGKSSFNYFKTLCLEEQEKIIKELKEVQDYNKVDVPYKLSILDTDIPVEYKSCALKKIDTLNYMDPGAGEYYKTKQWVDTFMRIPFTKYNKLPVKIEDGPKKVNDFMEGCKKTLDECCYGLNDAKMQIMQLIGQWVSNPAAVGNAIAIKGPPGTGKTTLVKEGVSKILNRPFAFIPLGGATDSSYLEGHSYTYEGSTWGKIVDVLITHKSMNPVFYFDELDKVSQTPKGEEIIGILTHLTDTTQNDKFHDKYFSNIDFNLNKCLFIFSYNDETKVNPILKDRMYRIKTKGYSNSEKQIICKDYLIPKIEKNVNFKKGDIIIPNETIDYINTNIVEKEGGVRNMKRAIEIIYTKLNLHRLMKKGSSLFDSKESIDIDFPFNVTKEIVDKLVKRDQENSVPFGMYM